jgi:hypothetical protein
MSFALEGAWVSIFFSSSTNQVTVHVENNSGGTMVAQEVIVYCLPNAQAYSHSFALKDTCWITVEIMIQWKLEDTKTCKL